MNTVLNDPFLLREVLFRADYDTVMNYCQSYLQAQEICRDNVFWLQKAQYDFNVSPNEFKNAALSSNLRYLELYTENGGVAFGSDDFINMKNFVHRAVEQNKDYLVQYAIKNGFEDWDILIFSYAMKGNQQMVDFYLKLSPNYHTALRGALRGGHFELFQYLFKKAPKGQWDWFDLDQAAGQSNKQTLESYGFVRGLYGGFDMGNLLDGVAWSGNQQLFDEIRDIIPNSTPLQWGSVFHYALYSENRNFIDHILALAPPNYPNLVVTDDTIPTLQSGNIPLFDFVRSLLPPSERQDESWQGYAADALSSGKRAMFDHVRNLVSSLTVNYQYDWTDLAENALESGNKYLFNYVQSLAPLNYPWNWNELIYGAIYSGNRKLINYVRSLMPSNYQLDWNIIINRLRSSKYNSLIDYAQRLFSS